MNEVVRKKEKMQERKGWIMRDRKRVRQEAQEGKKERQKREKRREKKEKE